MWMTLLMTTMVVAGMNSAVIASVPEPACVVLSQPAVEFAADRYDYRPVTVTAAEEDVVMVMPSDSWLQTAEVPGDTVAANSTVRFYVAPDGPTVTRRSASIEFRGLASGRSTALTVSQEPMTVADSFPAKWHYGTDEAAGGGWLDHGAARANMGVGRNGAMMTAVGVNNRRLGHVLATSYKQSIGIANLYTGDYLLFSVPVKALPAGCDVDFMLTIAANDNTAPKYWVAEILDGGEWRKPDGPLDLRQTDGEDYSFYTKWFNAYQYATFAQTFTLRNAIDNGLLQVRCRVVGRRNGADGELSPLNAGTVFLPSHDFTACGLTAYPGIRQTDMCRVAVLGNSFTYFNGSLFMLKEIARSQGHRLDMRAHLKGAQSFRSHMGLERSVGVIDEPGYDYVILQDQSEQHNKLADGKGDNVIADTKALTARFRAASPDARIILENTWCSPKKDWNTYGSPEIHTDRLLTGALHVAQADPDIACVSPVGVAFESAYKAGIPGLWHSDMKHPGRNGSYLKACVHYLVLYGEPFTDSVPDCECDPAIAGRLRDIAEQTVLGHETDYGITR